MSLLRSVYRVLALLAAAMAYATAMGQAPATNTDPARARVVLPVPANPALPSVILIGDSTVRNGHDDGQGKGEAGQWGWGTPLAAYIHPARANLVNRAVGGLSSRTYLTGGHWGRTMALVKDGDVVLMQFGHNDASPIDDDKRARGTLRGTGDDATSIDNALTGQRETVRSYGWYLRKFIAAVRARGATPVVVSPIPRKRWVGDGPDAGKVRRNGADYAGWALEVARAEGAGFIDLNEQVARRYDEMGRDAVMALFPATVPDESVHTNWAGAALNARYVAAGLRALGDARIAGWLRAVDDGPRDMALPTLFLVGDSTVQSGGQNGAIGWGECLATYLDARRINLVNAAIGGRSSRTFYTEGRWQRVLAQLEPGDVVLIQFGHNDGGRIGDPASRNRASRPGTGPETQEDILPDGRREQVHSFGWYMARYVLDAKAKGAMVVIASPVPHRDRWQSGRDFSDFAAWGREVAQAGGAHFIDLTLLVADGYRGLGAPQVDTFFADARTHTNAAGAGFNARQVAVGLAALPGNPLGPYLAATPAGQGHGCDAWGKRGAPIYQDDFGNQADGPAKGYVSEYARKPGNRVGIERGRLVIDVGSGATVWLDRPLSGNILIAYTRRVVMEGGRNDRLSDLNQFWMAIDPARDSLFTRSGKFGDYDDLHMYYAGIGGNGNTTTRLRRYGDGQRRLVGEHPDPAFLLAPNRDYRVEIALYDGCTRLRLDGRDVFTYRDPQPLTRGYFGFRTTWSHQEIDQFSIHRLE